MKRADSQYVSLGLIRNCALISCNMEPRKEEVYRFVLSSGECKVTSNTLIWKYIAGQPGAQKEAKDRDAGSQLIHLEITVEISGMGYIAFKRLLPRKQIN